MARGGKREGAGRRKVKPDNPAPNKLEAREIIDSLGKTSNHADKCLCWKCLWRRDAERQDSLGQTARKYLWDRDAGKPMDTVNHLHDKPLEMNVNVTLSEAIQKARKRAGITSK